MDKNIIVMSPQTFAAYRGQTFETESDEDFVMIPLMPVFDCWCRDWVGHMIVDGEHVATVELPKP